MSEVLPLPTAPAQSLYAALVVLAETALLLPNAALIEVLPLDRLHSGDGPPGWLGTVDWEGRTLPALSFEALNGAPPPEPHRRSRLAVLHALGKRLPDHAWALLCEGYPRLLPLNAAALTSLALEPDDRAEFILARVRIGIQVAIIPDLDRIESELAAALAGRS